MLKSRETKNLHESCDGWRFWMKSFCSLLEIPYHLVPVGTSVLTARNIRGAWTYGFTEPRNYGRTPWIREFVSP